MKTTIISRGKHQITAAFVFRVKTFLNTIFFNPLCSFLYPMLVCRLTNTKNCCFGYAFTTPELVFKMNGFSLSAIVDLLSRPTCSSNGNSSGLQSGILTSEVTALLITSLTILMPVTVSCSIFLQLISGSSIRQCNFILCSIPYCYMYSYPLNYTEWNTYFGYAPTKICIFFPGFNTIFSCSTQSLLPYLRRKNPHPTDFDVRLNVKNAAQLDIKGNIDQPKWPGSTVPRSKELGNFKSLFCFIIINILSFVKYIIKKLTEQFSSYLNLSQIQNLNLCWLCYYVLNIIQGRNPSSNHEGLFLMLNLLFLFFSSCFARTSHKQTIGPLTIYHIIRGAMHEQTDSQVLHSTLALCNTRGYF